MAIHVPPCRLGISSISLGRCYAGHTLQHRLDVAKKYGFEGIEMFIEDIEFIAASLPMMQTGVPLPPPVRMARAAGLIGNMCAERRLHVICLQPFRNYEGLVNRESHLVRLEQLRQWCHLAALLSTDLVVIPSNFLPAERLSGDIDVLVADLQAAAQVAAHQSPPIRLCYEALAWGTHVNTWEHSWELVRVANCPNLGLCLDTFNIAARAYADPTTETGLLPNADDSLRRSLERMALTLDPQKVFLVQLADAEAMKEPLTPSHPLYDPEMPPRMSWSRNCRLFYGETARGGYLPISLIVSCIFGKLGYIGWASFEVFHRDLANKDASVPEELARRGVSGWRKLVKDVKLHELHRQRLP